ncbi:MAG TPA: aminotransferase class III-fold pyridoxal phosphate-dependent enzyme [Verrucomicrobiae bacterium]|nr:aminotransferase class III-fold pyridoxal phosphate-dependent enzyme [Verrucomicrobiae bacterium]
MPNVQARQAAAHLANADLDQALVEAEAHYRARHPKSAARKEEASQHMPGGNTRTVLHFTPFPLVWSGGKGNRLTDVDGMEYVDFLGEYTAGLYGHSEPVIQAAQKKAIDEGTVLGGPNQYEARLAAAIRARFPSVELIRFTNSGTEANLMALSALRALDRKRPRIMAFEHAYHGGVFYFSPGHDQLNFPIDWLVGAYNDVEGTRALLRRHAQELAAVIVEPMLGGGGCIPGTPEFLKMLRQECTALGIVLVFDEVMTSRLSPSGLQGRLGITPDMTTFGKYLGGGTSFGAFGGKREVMAHFDPDRPDSIPHAGTFNNNVLSMAGGLAGLTQVFTPEAAVRINALGDALRKRLGEIASKQGAPVQATGVGSLLNIHFSRRPIVTAADAHPSDPATEKAVAGLQKLFHLDMIDQGYYFARRGFVALSLPTTEADTQGFAAAFGEFLEARGALIERSLPA